MTQRAGTLAASKEDPNANIVARENVLTRSPTLVSCAASTNLVSEEMIRVQVTREEATATLGLLRASQLRLDNTTMVRLMFNVSWGGFRRAGPVTLAGASSVTAGSTRRLDRLIATLQPLGTRRMTGELPPFSASLEPPPLVRSIFALNVMESESIVIPTAPTHVRLLPLASSL